MSNAEPATISAPVPACAVVGMHKNYGGVEALTGVDLAIRPGLVHAIVGENGAGKSTLMKVLVGAESPDAGEIFVRGRSISFSNVEEANREGIAIVFQELSLFPDLDVLANLFVLRQPRRLGLISRAEMRRRARPVLDQIGLRVDLDAPVASLNLDERQLVAIARALLAESGILILDEPNSALNARETERLFQVVRDLRDRGVAVVYISHRLEEVFRIADVITVMRNGAIVETARRDARTLPEVVAAMIGRKPSEVIEERSPKASGSARLSLERVSVKDRIHDIDLTAAPGEIVGLAGLEGAGVATIFDVVFGVRTPDSGTITLPDGKPGPRNVLAAVRGRIALVPADRRNAGVMLEQSIVANITHVTAGVLGRHGFFLRRRELFKRARGQSEALRIKTASLWSPVNHLSGGNQQKVVLAKWLETDPHVVLLDDPTSGVDVGAKVEIYQIVHGLADEGRVVLFSSSELPEYVRLCDRVVALYQGRVCGELSGERLTERTLLEAINTGNV